MDILILGPQGAGKGTQAKRIAEAYAIPHIATGDMIRELRVQDSDLGREVKAVYDRGDLVSDDLMIRLIEERLGHEDAQDGFILDGFPRTLPQAEALDALLRELGKELSVVFSLQLTEQVAIERLTKRAEIEGRVDDTPDAIAKRLDLYRRETEPLIEWYRVRSKVVPIHGERGIDEVFDEIQQALEQAAVA